MQPESNNLELQFNLKINNLLNHFTIVKKKHKLSHACCGNFFLSLFVRSFVMLNPFFIHRIVKRQCTFSRCLIVFGKLVGHFFLCACIQCLCSWCILKLNRIFNNSAFKQFQSNIRPLDHLNDVSMLAFFSTLSLYTFSNSLIHIYNDLLLNSLVVTKETLLIEYYCFELKSNKLLSLFSFAKTKTFKLSIMKMKWFACDLVCRWKRKQDTILLLYLIDFFFLWKSFFFRFS